jgi:DNA recombination protein Rad52
MGFTDKQIAGLHRPLSENHIRTRQTPTGKDISYIEGWHAIAEANRIFGFDGWSRETLESKCVMARENRGTYCAVYTSKVRITVHAGDRVIIREGHGTGEGKAASPGEVHDTALKTAETDATKRALATFGKPFGLSLYLSAKKAEPRSSSRALRKQHLSSADAAREPVWGVHHSIHEQQVTGAVGQRGVASVEAVADLPRIPRGPSIATSEHIGAAPDVSPTNQSAGLDNSPATMHPIDKSELAVALPRRYRDKEHLRYVAAQPCLICSRTPSDAHHVRFAQPKGLGLKSSDEFTVPLCRIHHRQLHASGNEVLWWNDLDVDPLPIAEGLWQESLQKRRSR